MPRLRPRVVLPNETVVADAPFPPRAPGQPTVRPAARSDGSGDQGSSSLVGRLVTYVPTEAITTYHTVMGVVPEASRASAGLWLGVFLLLLTPFWVAVMTRDRTEPIAWHQVGISTGAFLIWLVVVGNPLAAWLGISQTWVGTLMMTLYVIIVVPLVERLVTGARGAPNGG